jgi:hypothetical protein
MLLRAEVAISALSVGWSGLIMHNNSKLHCYMCVLQSKGRT